MRKLLVAIILTLTAIAARAQMVDYIDDTIFAKEDNYFKLLSGSQWVFLRPAPLAIIAQPILITIERNGAFAHHNGWHTPVRYIGGTYFANRGFIVDAVQSYGDGKVLKMADGAILTVSDFDTFHSGFWLYPCRTLVDGPRRLMWNIGNGQKVNLTEIDDSAAPRTKRHR